MKVPHQSLLIQFAKAPSGNHVKTRLASVLSHEQRCRLHCAMSEWVCKRLHAVCDGFELWVAGDSGDTFIKDLNRQYGIAIREQHGRDLGQRMAAAIQQGLQHYQQVFIVGSDCPFVDADYINTAIKRLNHADIVIGPAVDGGYVLLGLKQFYSTLFTDIDWGTNRVLKQTLSAAEASNLSVALLPALNDIDQAEDLVSLDNPELPDAVRYFAAFSSPTNQFD